jgi:hypothetical protein
MTRIQQLADAYVLVAKADHYMIGIIETVTADELDSAEQILIHLDNAADNQDATLNLALDCLANDRHSLRGY